MAIIDKLESIANAIRRKTHKKPKLSLVDMVNEINNEWQITCYVKDFYIQDDGNHGEDRDGDWGDRLDDNIAGTGMGIALSYTLNGAIGLTARTLSNSFENVQWRLDSAPSGVSFATHEWSSWAPAGDYGQYQTCFLQGINDYCRIVCWCGERHESPDTIDLWVKVEYITE